MSCRDKCFERPKVRFSKSAESPERDGFDRAFGKPKIRSITSIKPRVKILKAPPSSFESRKNSSPDEIFSRRCAGDAPNDADLCPLKSTSFSTPCLTEILLTPEGRIPHAGAPLDKRKTVVTLSSPELAAKTPKSILVEKKFPSAQAVSSSCLKYDDKSAAKPSKPSVNEDSGERILTRNRASADGKENVASRETRKNVSVKVPNNTQRPSESRTKSATSMNIPSSVGDKSWKSAIVGRSTAKTATRGRAQAGKGTGARLGIGATSIGNEKKSEEFTRSQKSAGSKNPSIGSMPRTGSKEAANKNVPMKKTILREASAKPSKVYVGPGLLRSRSSEFEKDRKAEKLYRSSSEIDSSGKFARPEYNSIVCTIRKLREAREEKIVPDPEHLPAIYRRLINGKVEKTVTRSVRRKDGWVSSALDFGANEAIYRDLVDLSIDEKQLPSRLTRSKDPEPRQRDVAPKLSDFFVPSNDEEFRRAVIVRAPSPRIIDTWNPYRISDRIFTWKESLDHDL